MGVFTDFILRLRAPILVTVAVVTALLAYRLPTLRQDEDVLKFLPAEDADIQLFRRVSREFGGLDVAIIGVESPRLLTADGISKVRQMTRAAAAVDGVYHTLSFTEVPHLTPSEEEFAIDPLVPEKIPNDRERLEEIRENVLHDAIVTGRLVSETGDAAMILCFLEAEEGQQGVAQEIQRAVRAEAGSMQLYFGGLPFVQLHIGGGTRRDIVRLTPYVLIIAALATFIFFRRPLGSLLVLSSVALGTVWTIGGMAAMGAPMTVVSTSLPMVLVAIGGAYGAHVLAAFYVARAPTAPERVVLALREVGPPVVASMMTTVAGFASFLAMDVAPMRAFGFQASVGVFLCGLLAMIVVPAVLSFGRGKPKAPPAERLGPPITKAAVGVRRHRWVTFTIVLAIGAFAATAAWRVAPDTSMESFFRPGSGPARADQFLRDQFGGSVFVQVYVRGDLRDPVVLDELRAIVEEARTIEGVTDVNSFLETLETLSAGLGGVARLPRTREQVSGLRPFMVGNPALRQLVDDELTRGIIQITLGSQDTRVVAEVVDHLREFIESEIPSQITVVQIYGDRNRVGNEDDEDDEETAEVADDPDLIRAARARRLRFLAGRVVRRLEAAGATPSPTAREEILTVLREHFADWTLEPGADLEREVLATTNEFFQSDDSPFEPFDATAVGRSLAPTARQPVTEQTLDEVLPRTLPEEQATDAVGVEMTAPALAERISDTRARVLASRLTPEILRVAGIEERSDAVVEAVRGVLEEADDARVGLDRAVEGRRESLSLEVGVTGTPVINRAFGASTQRNQIRSIVIAVVALLLLSSVMFRSARLGLIAVLPAGVTLLITFGLMGWFHMPLDPGTTMVAALALGIGIDYAIHFLWRRRWRGLSLKETANSVGPAILFNAVQVASGFAVMILADTVPLSRFGVLVTVAMLVAAVATFTILPAFERDLPDETS